MKKVFTVIFLLCFLALFIIIGSIEDYSLSLCGGIVLAVADFVVMLISGVISGMLNFNIDVEE